MRTEDSRNAFRAELQSQNYVERDTDKEYKVFLKLFKSLYVHINCAKSQDNMRQNYTRWPWITKGLQNGFKKNKIKNSLNVELQV